MTLRAAITWSLLHSSFCGAKVNRQSVSLPDVCCCWTQTSIVTSSVMDVRYSKTQQTFADAKPIFTQEQVSKGRQQFSRYC
jgi:hypothetical protein